MKLYDVPQIDGQLYLRDETDLWGFLQNGKYEPEETELIKKLVKPNDICLDIGANIGYFTVLMAKQCKNVYAFEPEPTNFHYLELNVQLNRLTNVELIKKAVSNLPTTTDIMNAIPLYLCSKSHGMHRIFESKHCDKEPLWVHNFRLDDFRFHVFDFVKIDVEGSELGVIKGMFDIIKENHPTMLLEFHPPTIHEYGADPRELYYLLKGLDYDIRLVPNIDETISYEDLYARTNNESGGQNILCQKK